MSSKNFFANPVFFFVCFIIGTSMFNCVPEEEILDFDYTNGLAFSSDTVLFDTVFTGVGSVTKRFKAYNLNRNAVKVDNIRLGLGQSSSYEVIVNGSVLDESQEITILGQDSVLILVEVFIDPQDDNQPYLVRDSIIFETNGIVQDVKLIAWGQDAVYLGNEVLPCNSVWSNQRPYVLYSSILIDTLCELRIEKGTKIFATKDAFIYVQGSIEAEGTASERITFRNERLDFAYENLPGQWGGLIFLEGSHGNNLNFCVIRNAQYGVRLGSPDNDTIPDVLITNTIIENMSNSGILAFTSDLYAENVLVNNCFELNVGSLAGGNYTFNHCTIANYGLDFIRETPSLFISDNISLDDGNEIVEPVTVIIQNSIVDGNLDDEIQFNLSGNTASQFSFSHSMFRTTIADLDTLENIINENPEFIDPFAYNYRLDTLSPAKDHGRMLNVEFDLDGNMRDEFPDLGAFERFE